MNTVTIEQENRRLIITRFSPSDFPEAEQELQGIHPMEIEVTLKGLKSRIWFDTKEEFDFFCLAIQSYYEDFRNIQNHGE